MRPAAPQTEREKESSLKCTIKCSRTTIPQYTCKSGYTLTDLWKEWSAGTGEPLISVVAVPPHAASFLATRLRWWLFVWRLEQL